MLRAYRSSNGKTTRFSRNMCSLIPGSKRKWRLKTSRILDRNSRRKPINRMLSCGHKVLHRATHGQHSRLRSRRSHCSEHCNSRIHGHRRLNRRHRLTHSDHHRQPQRLGSRNSSTTYSSRQRQHRLHQCLGSLSTSCNSSNNSRNPLSHSQLPRILGSSNNRCNNLAINHFHLNSQSDMISRPSSHYTTCHNLHLANLYKHCLRIHMLCRALRSLSSRLNNGARLCRYRLV